jgi:hypothetical protein
VVHRRTFGDCVRLQGKLTSQEESNGFKKSRILCRSLCRWGDLRDPIVRTQLWIPYPDPHRSPHHPANIIIEYLMTHRWVTPSNSLFTFETRIRKLKRAKIERYNLTFEDRIELLRAQFEWSFPDLNANVSRRHLSGDWSEAISLFHSWIENDITEDLGVFET